MLSKDTKMELIMASSFGPCTTSTKRFLLVACTGLFFWCTNVQSEFHIPKNLKFSALLVFGDSIVDPGNNNDVDTPAKANHPPYGKDFIGRKATGRFSNGKVPSDFIAQALAIKELLPAYLDPNLQEADLPTGVSFASGGCGYDPRTSQLGVARSLPQQLDQFKEYRTRLVSLVGESSTSDIISRTLFVVVAGSNDFANTYFGTQLRLEYDIESYTTLIANSAGDYLKDLYEAGARWIAVFSAPPLGCLPSQRTLAGGVGRECVDEYNQAAQLYNSKLSSAIDTFSNQYSDAQAGIIDIYNPLLDLIQNPEQNGFTVSDKGCCGTGKIEVTVLCANSDMYSMPICSDATKYVFFDTYHPTEATYKLLVERIFGEIFHFQGI